jgi:hypothetical protein
MEQRDSVCAWRSPNAHGCSEDLQRSLVLHYETLQKQVMKENAELRASLVSIQRELVQIMLVVSAISLTIYIYIYNIYIYIYIYIYIIYNIYIYIRMTY